MLICAIIFLSVSILLLLMHIRVLTLQRNELRDKANRYYMACIDFDTAFGNILPIAENIADHIIARGEGHTESESYSRDFLGYKILDYEESLINSTKY